jgi:glycosyltransferase involved in cell wall biosynthesis
MVEVSVVIPTKNGAQTIHAVLQRVYQQQGLERPEVLIVDSVHLT